MTVYQFIIFTENDDDNITLNIDVGEDIDIFLSHVKKRIPWDLLSILERRFYHISGVRNYIFNPIHIVDGQDIDYTYEIPTPLAPLPVSREILLSIFPG